jgi:diguanylate cyclase (GGDEF)-like protein
MSSAPPTAALLQIVVQPLLPPDVAAGLASSAFGPFELHASRDRAEVLARLAESHCDALILCDGESATDIAAEAGTETAILVVVDTLTPPAVIDWLGRGVQDVLLAEDLASPALPQRLRAAIERKRLEREARTAYATDLDTGLPHQQQLIEHMSQLLALREREPAPMAVLALRIEGLATAEARFGRDASNVLRRKVGVRLRAGVRASDVVASLGEDSFAVLLGSVLAPADAERVGAKLLKALLAPFKIAGEEVAVATALGVGLYPEDGTHPEGLLRRAVGLAAGTQAQGRAGFSNFAESAASAGAANDE